MVPPVRTNYFNGDFISARLLEDVLQALRKPKAGHSATVPVTTKHRWVAFENESIESISGLLQ
jgi:hypothetical protein